MHALAVPSSCRAVPQDSFAQSVILSLAADVADILDAHPDTPERCGLVARALEAALDKPFWLPDDLAEACATGYRRQVLFEADDGSFCIGCFVWGPGQHSPIHDHHTWGVIGCLDGALANESFADPAPDRLSAAPLQVLATGETLAMHHEGPVNIHRLGAHGMQRAISVHVYGTRFGGVNRTFYPTARALRTPARQAGAGQAAVAVIGSGFSGTMAAIHLARKLPPGQSILLCERRGRFAAGVAYSTNDPGHLLNVRAANMSAFAHDPGHFESWIEAQGDAAAGHVNRTGSGLFASRYLYGAYLQSVLRQELARAGDCGRIRLLEDDITDCVPDRDGYDLITGSSAIHSAHSIVLATGHVAPIPDRDPRVVSDPWAPGLAAGLDPAKPVMIVGTGLTMVDIVLSLRAGGFTGPILAASRRGLVSRGHRPGAAWPMPMLSVTELQSVRLMMRRLRSEIQLAKAQGVDWRAVVDSIRPVTALIWQSWPEAERSRFLRHARRYWDIHRHRMAPPNEAAIEAELAAGSLRLLAGHLGRIRRDVDALRVEFRPSGAAEPQMIEVQRLIRATGLAPTADTTDPLLRRLLERGLVRLDASSMGIDVTHDLRVIGGDGAVRPDAWALGPLVRGVFWECIAIPDIRHQVERLGIAATALALAA